MATKEQSVEVINLPKLEIAKVKVTIIGDSPLIMHKWSDKAKDMMRRSNKRKPLKAGRPRIPIRSSRTASIFSLMAGRAFLRLGSKPRL